MNLYNKNMSYEQTLKAVDDILRTDDQLGIFGEVNFDLVPDKIELTLGARWYDIEVDLEGSANSSFFNFPAQNRDIATAGLNAPPDILPPNNTPIAKAAPIAK